MLGLYDINELIDGTFTLSLNFIRGRTDKKLTSTLVIRTFLSFELADILLKYGSLLFFKKALKTLISILIANDDANTTPYTWRGITVPSIHLRDCIFWACHHTWE